MKNITWIIQTNLTSEVHRWKMALEACGSAYRDVEIVPFSDDLPDVSYVTDFALAHGTTSMIKNAHKKGWTVFFNPENFRPSLWRLKYGRNFLNYDGYACKLGETSLMGLSDKDCMSFVRPNGDFKDFSGSVVDIRGWTKFVQDVQSGGYPFDDQLEIFAAPAKNLFEEYRMFIVNGVVVSSSKYRLRTILDKKPGAPKEVVMFANNMAAIWNPERAYVMDVCKTDQGELKVLELNCFNASGVYAAPIEPIIEAVEFMYPMCRE
jgi:hypothetical protein